MNAEKHIPFDPFARVKELKHELEAAEYSRLALHHRLKLTQGIALMALGYAIITTITIAILLLKP